jgi:hypothetical protein
MNSAKYLIFLLLGLCAHSVNAQNYVFSNDIPVSSGNQPLKMAWAGGLNAPQFSEIDLDNDGLLDLAVFDRVGPRLLTFRNGGSAATIDYTFAPEYALQFPAGLKDWVLLRDFDNDGYIDLFTAVPQVSNVRVYRNTSALTGGTLSFVLFKDTLISVYPPTLAMYVGRSDIPAVDDIDGDGDLDILTFGVGGQKIEWHKNLSVENTGGLLGMDFDVQSRCFGHFEEDAFTCEALINRIPCGTGERMTEEHFSEDKIALHAGSTTLSLDLNNDGLKDLIIGDVGCPTLYALTNGGTSQIAHFVATEDHYPNADSSVHVTSFPSPYYVDIDNDGVKDLITAPNNTSLLEDVRGVMFHKNLGTNTQPQFQFQRYGVFQEDMIDLGTAASPVFFDHNGDGLQDLLIGGAGRYDSLVGYIPGLQLFENVGAAQSPSFELVSDNYLNLSGNSVFDIITWIKPAPGDLDGDGDQDLLLGASDGTLYHFLNSALPGTDASFSLFATNFAGIDVGTNSAPQLVDLDQDNDLDLLIGNHRGYIHYYDNIGTSTAANFVLVEDTFGMVKMSDQSGQAITNGFSQPLALDYDADGDFDLLVGGIDGQVAVYEDITLTQGASFLRGPDLFGYDFGLYSNPAATVLDSARLTYVVGDMRGGLMLLRDAGPVGIHANNSIWETDFRLFPNPASGQAFFEMSGQTYLTAGEYRGYDVLGREAFAGKWKGSQGSIDLAGVKSGIYFVVFANKSGTWSQKLIVSERG